MACLTGSVSSLTGYVYLFTKVRFAAPYENKLYSDVDQTSCTSTRRQHNGDYCRVIIENYFFYEIEVI